MVIMNSSDRLFSEKKANLVQGLKGTGFFVFRLYVICLKPGL